MDRNELLAAYDRAIAEYRFQVGQNWDRTKTFLILNSAVVAAVVGLYPLAITPGPRVVLAGLLASGIGVALLGRNAIWKGHQYYRATVAKKTLIEAALNYHTPLEGAPHPFTTLAVGTTEGMRKVDEIAADPEAWVNRPPRQGTIVGYSRLLFALLAAFHLGTLAMLVSGW